jgi:hypothetical protein
MAKSSKKVSDVAAPEKAPVALSDGLAEANGSSKPAKQPRAKAAPRKSRKTITKSTEKPSGAVVAKSSSVRKPKTPLKAAPKTAFTDDDVRIRAYFISEHRTRHGIPGSSADDWLEARRQLEAEADRRT